jgi:cell division protein FtsB
MKDLFERGARRFAYVAGFALIGGYGWIALKGPQGLQALIEKHREIQRLQEQNIVISRENERRRERIRRLAESPSEQQMEIRKQLKLQKPGETTFILPESPKGTKAEDPD